ncbi:importin subunit alpha-2 [Nematostella vectensis]|uniref:importin subunit alpha-2 n=1 Tax=Nematostella vectensis TaxID=45351 RepID=UPI002076F1EE|nr:importin subunit alpha-2 [Nematostella vectensis]
MNRKDLYKQGGHSVQAQRSRRRGQEADLRKERRERLLSSKRIRFAEEEAEEEDFTVEQVRDYAKAIQKYDSNTLHCLRSLRKAFAQGSELISAFMGVENGLRSVVGYLTGHNIDLQLEAAWCITNLSAGTHEDTLRVLKAAAPYLITYLSGQNLSLQDQCAWALGNMSGDSVECRDLLRAQGIVPPMANLLKSEIPSIVQSAAFALSNLARGHSQAADDMMGLGIASMICALLVPGQSTIEVVTEVSWVSTYLTSKPDNLAAFVESGVIDHLVRILHSLVQEAQPNSQAITPILRCLGNIISGPDEYGAMAMQGGLLLHAVMACLQSSHRHVRKESLWVLSNLTAGPAESCWAVVHAGLVPVTVKMLASEAFDIKKEVALTLCNISYHGPDCLKVVLDCRGMEGFVHLLKSHDQDTVLTALQFAEMALRLFPDSKNTFEELEGVACLEGLEYNCNETLRQYANELLDTYFMEETRDEEISEETHGDLSEFRPQEMGMTGSTKEAH